MELVPNILIVDDIDENLIFLEAIIRNIKVNLIKAFSGAEALEKTKGIELALAIIDVRMPGMNGYELAVKMNGERSGDKVPVIFITASHVKEMDVLEGYGSGAVDFIVKPVNRHILLSKVNVFLDLFTQKQTILRDAVLLKKSADKLMIINEVLKKSEEKYRSYIDNAPDGVFVADDTGRYIEVNEAACRMTGYSKEELLKMSIPDILPEESIEDGQAHFRKAVATGTSKADLLFRHKNGNKRWWTVESVKLSETRFLGFTEDITQRKEMEESLKTYQIELELQNDELTMAINKAEVASAKYAELYDFAPSGYFTLSAEHTIQELNHSGARMLGKDRSRLINSHFGVFISKNTLPVFNAFFLNVFKSNSKEVCEVIIQADGKHPKYVHIEGMVVNNGKQCLLNVVDITERKRAAKMSQDIIEKNPMSIQIVDKEGCTIKVNPAHTLLFGAAPPPGFSIFNDLQNRNNELKKLILRAKGGEIVYLSDLYYNLHDLNDEFPDVPLWLHAIIFPLNDEEGKPERFVIMHENITKRKHAEEMLRQSEERFRAVTQSANDAIITSNSLGIIIDWNKGAEKVFGYTQEEIIGKNLSVIMPEHYAHEHNKNIRRVMQGGEQHVLGNTVELVGLHKNGNEFPVEISLAAWETASGKFFTGIIRDITRRKQTEKVLRDSESNLAEAQRIAHIGSWEWDMISNSVKWSKEMYRVFDIDPDTYDEKPESLIKVMHQDDVELFTNSINGNTLSLDYRVIHKDGSVHNLIAEGRVEFNEAGKPVRSVGTVQDITERKLAEELLRESEEKFRGMANLLPLIVFETDLQGNLTYGNKQAFDSFGNLDDDFGKGLNVINFLVDSDKERARENMKNRLYGKPIENNEYSMVSRDGSTLQTLIYSNPIIIKNKAVGLRGIIVDITGRKMAEQAIKVSEEKYKTILNASPDGILLINMKGVITEVSEIGLELLGAENRNDVVGKAFSKFVSSDEKNTIKEIIEKTTNEGLAQNIGLKIRKKNQTLFASEMSATLIQGSDGTPLSFMIIIRDISHRKKMETKQIHADRMANLGEMASGIAHEINQPLNIISMVVDKILFETAKTETIDIEFTKNKLNKIFENITRIRNIIDHIRAFSRSHDDYVLTAFDVNLSIENAVSMIAEQFKYLGINLNLQLEKQIPQIFGNTYTFEQVIVNLLVNAKDAVIEKKGKQEEYYEMIIEIRSYQENQFIIVEITDNGIGISNDDIHNIILPFYTTKDEGKGTGLGLSICYQIIKEMDGTIDITSDKISGTKIKLVLVMQKKS